jgi:prepilin-type N-terminal cleavage/methylation domain-containing protein
MTLRNGQSSRASGEPHSPPAYSVPASRSPLHASRFTFHVSRAFTLIELILVMALLTIVISLTAPSLSRFFRGRTLDSEARRLLALTRSGQSRAVSEGMPMDLWVNAEEGSFGLEAEPSFETSDPKAVEFTVDSGLTIEVVNKTVVAPVNTISRLRQASTASTPRVKLARSTLPTIRFLPDGSIAENSPQMLRVTSADGGSLWVAQSRDGLNYEIRSTDKEDGTTRQLSSAR